MASASLNSLASRRERRRREIHERILEAATGLFGRKGFTATTVLEIADTADVAEKTFYNHFPTKQHLIAEIAQRKSGTMARLLAELHVSPGTAAERLHRFCERAADEAERSRVFTRELLFEVVRMAQVDGLGIDRHRGIHRAIQGLFQKSPGEAGDSALGILSELGVAAFIGIIINWVTIPNYPLRDRLQHLADVASEMIETRTASRSEEVRS